MSTPTPTHRPPATMEIRALQTGDVTDAVEVLARGFAEEPGVLALIPDPRDRLTVLRSAVRSELMNTGPFGTIHVATLDGEIAGVAIWHPPGASTKSLRALARTLAGRLDVVTTLARGLPHQASVVLRHTPDALPLLIARRRATARAAAGTSWHLAFLATAPEHRGRGLARGLLDRQLQRCDEDGVAAWLETTDPVNPPIYARFGFEVVTHVDRAAWLPGLWVMRREAVRADAHDRPGSDAS
jgi:GNAT superfamily N-acetyltransferase